MEPGQKAGYIHVEPLIEVHKEPLVVNPSPFVMASSRATLNLIDRNQVISNSLVRYKASLLLQYTFSGELPPACRALYETVLSCELDSEFETGTMESRLSDAIR